MTGFTILVDIRLCWTKEDIKGMLRIRDAHILNGFDWGCGVKVSTDDMGAVVIQLNDDEAFRFDVFKFDYYSNLIEEVEG